MHLDLTDASGISARHGGHHRRHCRHERGHAKENYASAPRACLDDREGSHVSRSFDRAHKTVDCRPDARARGKNRFVPLSVDDPIHPCFLEHGIDSVEKKVSWIGFRISETCHAAGRVCLLDCLPQWEDEHGVSIVIRDGQAVATADGDVNIDDFDQRSVA
ncbi:hypothetical protein LP420_40030 [Massilia sp. B-10]|nr:hypothetical protein LP420_40030 [Massilia sp. B-10]